jgi:hypothetical protein
VVVSIGCCCRFLSPPPSFGSHCRSILRGHFLELLYLVRRAKWDMPFHLMFIAFGVFIIACGATHFMEVWTLWTPVSWLSGTVKVVTAVLGRGLLVFAACSFGSHPRDCRRLLRIAASDFTFLRSVRLAKAISISASRISSLEPLRLFLFSTKCINAQMDPHRVRVV